MSTEIIKSNQTVEPFNFLNTEHFANMQRVCMMFANSELVPLIYRISPENPKEKAIANCMIAIEMASRIGASPLMVMQNLYIVHGNPGWSSKFLTATVNTCGKYDSIEYKFANLGKVKLDKLDIDNWECIAFTKQKGSDKILESSPVSIKMAIDEGWYTKKGSKWPNMPKLMLQYRAVAFWTRVYAPELSMGIKTAEEFEDIAYEDVSVKLKEEVKTKANKTEIKMDVKEEVPPANNGKVENLNNAELVGSAAADNQVNGQEQKAEGDSPNACGF